MAAARMWAGSAMVLAANRERYLKSNRSDHMWEPPHDVLNAKPSDLWSLAHQLGATKISEGFELVLQAPEEKLPGISKWFHAIHTSQGSFDLLNVMCTYLAREWQDGRMLLADRALEKARITHGGYNSTIMPIPRCGEGPYKKATLLQVFDVQLDGDLTRQVQALAADPAVPLMTATKEEILAGSVNDTPLSFSSVAGLTATAERRRRQSKR